MPPRPGAIIPSDAGARLQFTRVVAVLKKMRDEQPARPDTLERIQAEIQALPDEEEGQLAAAQASMRSAKAGALADIVRFTQTQTAPPDAAAVRRWLTDAISRYERVIAGLAR